MNPNTRRAVRLHAALLSRWESTRRDFAGLVYEATPPSVRDYLKEARARYDGIPTRIDELHLGTLGMKLGLDWDAWNEWVGTDPFANPEAPDLTFMPTPRPGARAIQPPPPEGPYSFDDALAYFEQEADERVPDGGTLSCRFVAGMILDALAVARAVRYAQAGAAVKADTPYTDAALRQLAPHARPALWPVPASPRIVIWHVDAPGGDGAGLTPGMPTLAS